MTDTTSYLSSGVISRLIISAIKSFRMYFILKYKGIKYE